MEQKKHYTLEDRYNYFVDQLSNQKIHPTQFLLNAANKIEGKGYDVDWVQRESNLACRALIDTGKCHELCDNCCFQQTIDRIVYEIVTGARRAPHHAMQRCPRITKGAQVYEHMSMKELKTKHDAIHDNKVRSFKSMLTHAKVSMKNTITNF